MADLAEFYTVLTLESAGFTKGLVSAQAAAEESSTKIGAAWQKMAEIGKAASLVVVAGAAASVKMAMDFDQQMALVHTQAGASLAEVSKLSNQVLALAGQVGIGPTTLAEGLYHVESAGYRGAQAMDILTAASKAATIGQSDLETTTQALIGVMASGIGGVKNAADAAAYLNTTVGIGDMRMDKLSAAIATGVLPSFRSAGLSMSDFSASLATLTDNVTPADEAATRLRMSVSLMEAPSKAATAALATIGLKSTSLADDMKKPDGLLVAVQDLKTHLAATFGPQSADDVNHYVQLLQTKGVTAANAWADSSSKAAAVLEKAFGGGKTSAGILTLVGETDRLKSKYEALGTSTSRAKQMQDAWQTQQALFSQRLKDLGASAEALGVKIGNKLIPPLSAAIGWLTKHTAAVKILAVVVGSLLVAAVFAWTGAVIANTAALLANPVTWIVIGIVALVVALYELVTHWKTVWGALKTAALAVWHALQDAWNATWKAIASVVSWIKSNIIDPIVTVFKVGLIDPIKAVVGVLVDMFKIAWEIVSGIFRFAADLIYDIASSIARTLMKVLSPVLHVVAAAWSIAWGAIKTAAKAAYNDVIKPVAGFIVTFAIRPIEAGITALGRVWSTIWGGIKTVANDAWTILKKVFGLVVTYGFDPIKNALNGLKTLWDTIWGGIETVVKKVWDVISPILTKIGGALSKIGRGISDIVHSPSTAAKKVASFLGFDQGGWVPGAAGSPVLAVVHGGEFVVSRDMLAGRTATPIRMGGAASSAGNSTTVFVQSPDIYLDGKKVSQGITTRAQRTKKRNGQTFLS